MAASPEEQARAMIANLKEKTGRSLEEWLDLLRGREGDKHGQIVTKSRVDLGLRLDGVDPAERLEASGSSNSMVSHRIRLTGLDGFDERVRGWLEAAYRDA